MSIFNLGSTGTGGDGSGRTMGAATCSRKGCRAGAEWQLLWNNPKIHTPDRRKVWLSCGEHRDWLEDYLQTRGLWKETVPFTASEATANEAG
ncbi:hypothetical protein [Paenarthrobacter aurescens]|uniref:Acetone carboxylase n=1 Tax=Paenarthrobacter aurescens TaxID=43663 RepID=A0A4Y3NLB2_PAEAU|nr:hypothetical protein [Paenarthrobacter aurescens]UKA51819.1 hypothetical protein LFT48_09995 [Arthrobacter sp. FW305-123]MDO6143566.1 hypothetical protein [Paenarthrobacter aurescens]MDO6147414.1 hypothetical protein [Paenarthrobacter aurescens]MDO6158658.1 hypothetical protein [Paenarthrobacter aurescens]MDO6162641.1 hypothetical protein [Paenarthrobacter aurescens]